jgi:5-methylcytosine-specific restriction endonuclease McrA
MPEDELKEWQSGRLPAVVRAAPPKKPSCDNLVYNRWPRNSRMAQVVARDGLNCRWCGRLCDPSATVYADNYPTKDHVIRRADGGTSELDNLVVACRKCNNERHSPNWTPLKITSSPGHDSPD